MRYMPTPRNPRAGAILVQVTVFLTVLMGVLAVVLDGGMLLTERRHAQGAADAAALAAAADLFANYLTNGGYDTGGTAKTKRCTATAKPCRVY